MNDLLFKFIFGHKENKEITLSFINAVLGLEGERAFVDLRFADRAIDPEEEHGKRSALDLLCMTNDETQINIEVQVQNRQNMGQRSLYYWAKLYQSTLGRGENYENLRRTVAINLLGYTYLPLSGFHHMYGPYDETGVHRLTEDIEIHFLELPKVTIYCTQGCGHGARRDGEKPGKHCSDENTLGDEENFFMNRFRCKKLLLRLTEKPISMDSPKKVKFLAHGQSKKVWNPCNRTLVQGSESFRMDKAAMVHAS